MSDVARQNNFVRPVLVNEPCLEIIGGRHPLQELCVDHFVPNDTLIGGENGSIKLITGKLKFSQTIIDTSLSFRTER